MRRPPRRPRLGPTPKRRSGPPVPILQSYGPCCQTRNGHRLIAAKFESKEAGMASLATTDERRDALVERLFEATLGAFDLLTVYVGDRLGLYRALADRGSSTSAELAEAAGIHERYARGGLQRQGRRG